MSPYKDKETAKKASKERMRRFRGVTSGVTNEVVTEKGVTKYPAIIHALVDPEKRKKLERIHQSLKNHGVVDEVHFGMGWATFGDIGQMLEVT